MEGKSKDGIVSTQGIILSGRQNVVDFCLCVCLLVCLFRLTISVSNETNESMGLNSLNLFDSREWLSEKSDWCHLEDMHAFL